MNKALINRTKSFFWRLAMMVVVVLADYVLQNLTGFQLPAAITITIGLVAGEISKYFNQVITEMNAVAVRKPVSKRKKK